MRKQILKSALLAAAILGATSAMAAPINYSYVEGGFGQLDEGDAVFFNGAKDLNQNWDLVGGLEIGQFDFGAMGANADIDLTMLEIGGQYHQPVDSRLSWHAGLKLLYVKVEGDITHPVFGTIGSFDEDDVGLVANGGLRFLVNPKFQLEGDIKLFMNDALADDGLGLQGAARYYFDPKFSVAGGLAVDTELDGLFVSLRYDL